MDYLKRKTRGTPLPDTPTNESHAGKDGFLESLLMVLGVTNHAALFKAAGEIETMIGGKDGPDEDLAGRIEESLQVLSGVNYGAGRARPSESD